ncbi:MAG: aminotransferase class V-fold PLP-dependent enzyme [Pseudomonadota bacterium]|nr:aminotransferase class V-fold PLP-dependent enzyme [Pseudomonadota bacterium]
MTIYLNTATTGYPKSSIALAAMTQSLTAAPSDVRHSSKPAIELARQKMADLLGADAATVFYVSDATLGLNLVIQSEAGHSSGVCLTDNRAHNAVTRTLYGVAGNRWASLDLYDLHETPRMDVLVDKLDPTCPLICLTHTSNVFGTTYDLAPVIAKVRQIAPDCAILVDASQTAGSAPMDGLQEADFIVFPGHKHLHSTPGAAVLVARRRLRTLVYGGTGTYSARLSMEDYRENVVEVGTPNLPAIEALAAAALEYHEHGGHYRAHIQDMVAYLIDGLWRIEGVTPLGLGAQEGRNGTVACLVPGLPEQEWVPLLASQNIVVRGGLHCCPLAHREFAHPAHGSLRISLNRFTTVDELDALLSVMDSFAGIAAQ